MMDKGEVEKKKFYDTLSERFEDGRAVEIIDGDSDNIERDSFKSVMEWVHMLQ